MSNTETISQAAAVGELREWLRVALDRIETLEGELAECGRQLAELRLARAVDRAPHRPTIAKPLRPRTDAEWRDELRAAGFSVRDGG